VISYVIIHYRAQTLFRTKKKKYPPPHRPHFRSKWEDISKDSKNLKLIQAQKHRNS